MATVKIYNDCVTVSYNHKQGANCTKVIELIDEETGEITYTNTSRQNLDKGLKNKSGFGKSARKRFMSCIDSFSSLLEVQNIRKHESLFYKYNNITYKRKPIFLTLTIPNQTISDKECNRNLLNQFLSIVCRNFPIKLWLWRAEVQSRGTLHYHLILDCFIPHSFIRKLWYNLLVKYNQQGSIKNVLFASRIFFVKSINKIDAIKFYLQNYLSEIDNEGKERVNKHDKVTVLRQIECREWGCCDFLKDVQTKYINANQKVIDIIEFEAIEKKSIILENKKCIADTFVFKKFVKKIGTKIYEKLENVISIVKDNYYNMMMQLEYIYMNSINKPPNVFDFDVLNSKKIIEYDFFGDVIK